ncbi:macrophage mannose receptor 1 [Ictalurus punctatus]|uniref:Macrophage mannose receptor 1 n=1 Tax=Ictalurus punctatus TaxID=7998 RepID=A0A2D0QU30_ICTPU|nr:macrophage mannose receptor 1 [Ictalurus punctatus]
MKSLLFVFLLAVGCGAVGGLIREYMFIRTPAQWSDARLYCRTHSKDLANVTTMEENQRLIESGSGSQGWLGLRLYNTTTWTFFTNWCDDCPNMNVKCVYTNRSGFWNTNFCMNMMSFYCYRFLILVKENKTWEEALDHCRTYYTGLASVTSESSLQQLNLETVQTQTESVWTGLRFINGQWLWVSGEQLGSLVSMPSCPAPAYRCGALNTTTNTLMNRNCNERLNFVCYWT